MSEMKCNYKETETHIEDDEAQNLLKNEKLTKTEHHHPNQSQFPIASASTIQETPPIFKQNIDCFDDWLDYLTLGEIYEIGNTCKTMQKIAAVHFQRNYLATRIIWKHDGFIY